MQKNERMEWVFIQIKIKYFIEWLKEIQNNNLDDNEN